MADVQIRRRLGRHTSGTKWYNVLHITLFSAIGSENFVVYLWGPNGRVSGSKILRDDQATVDAYEKKVEAKRKRRNGEFYNFEPEQVETLTSDITANTAMGFLEDCKMDSEKVKPVFNAIIDHLKKGGFSEEKHHMEPVIADQPEEETGERNEELLKAWGTFA